MKKLKPVRLQIAAPRNPLVAAARFRKHGRHEKSEATSRQAARRQVREEMARGREAFCEMVLATWQKVLGLKTAFKAGGAALP